MAVLASTNSTNGNMNISENSDSLTEILIVTSQVGCPIN